MAGKLIASVKEYFRNPQKEFETAVLNHDLATARQLLEQYGDVIDINKTTEIFC